MFELNPVIPATSEKERLPAEQLLSQQIADHQAQNSKRSLLASALGTVYSNGDGTLSELEALQHNRKQAALGQDVKTLSQIDSQIRSAVKEDTGALETRQHLDHLTTGLFKTATLFMPAAGKAGWAARAATAVVFGLDNARSGDSTGQQLLDGGLGATKGLALRGILGASGRVNNPFIQGTLVGASSRGMDVLLSTNSYVGMDGQVNVGKGLTTAFSSAFDKRALAVDGMLFTAAAGLGMGAQAIGPDKLFRTPLAHTVTTSASFGFTTGAYTEMSRQTTAGEELDLGKVVKWGLTQSAVDGIAGIPGGLMRNRLALAPTPDRLESRRVGSEHQPDLLKPGNNVVREPAKGEPLNVYSRGPEATGRFWSNFAHTPFTMDGTRFASVEGFYVALKTADPALKAKAAGLSGFEAKQFGKELPKSDVGFYGGKTFKMGSPEHHGLVERALRTKADHYPQMAQALAETFPRPIVHDVGRPEGRTNYPAAVFAKTLEAVRADIIAARGEPIAKMEQQPRTTGDTGQPVKPVSEILRSITDADAHRTHAINDFARAFENSPFQAKRVVAIGGDTISVELSNGNIMKMTNTRRFVDNMGERPFDLPILERGVQPNPMPGRDIQFFIQPKAQSPVPDAEVTKFMATAREHGYRFTDPKASNLGIYEGKVYLLDPWAVER